MSKIEHEKREKNEAKVQNASTTTNADKSNGHPQALSEPKKSEGRSISLLSEPISHDRLLPWTPYIIKELNSSRVLCINHGAAGDWEWPYLGEYDDYLSDVIPIELSEDPTVRPAMMGTKAGFSLHSNGTSTSWDWVFFGKEHDQYPIIKLKAKVIGKNSDGRDYYQLSWNNKNIDMSLSCEPGAWNWLYISSAEHNLFTIHQRYLTYPLLKNLLKNTWPHAEISDGGLHTLDRRYLMISEKQAKKIYEDSMLSQYKWKEDVFDCDDFSFVYKAQASMYAYKNNAECGYAVGVLFGLGKSGSGHVINIFIDYASKVKIIEPQSGKIIDGKDWSYTPFFILI
ncbi:hypothetical protein FKD06_25280 [Serratia sp. SRS-8-S-2018]|uniref:lectin MOA-related protein n=1 Tax=Serratia sp. SRS-8-S-2018 TaxID=2591107 RepID=UPI0011406449|nr:lectin MOA-related protein [Serratia sp. SRS-8-S-2018]TPW38731.1 hypothetical protein FKD06_25280 [Serratia sp. SRS-8-S-2018]